MKNLFHFVTIIIVIFYPSLNAQWIQTNGSYNGGTVQCFVVNGSDLFASTDEGVFHSTNNGINWTEASVDLANASVRALVVSSNGIGEMNIFAETDGNGVFLSTDNGINWNAVNTGLQPFSIVHAFALSDTDLFAGTFGSGVWKRPLSEMTTSVEDHGNKIPSQFILEQNFPNPFNPSTKIRYSVPQSSNVLIKVYDILGNEIETLVNEEKLAGTYEITWYVASAVSGHPSGVYFYIINTGRFVETKKMILMK